MKITKAFENDGNFIRLTEDVVAKLNMPKQSKEFLCNVGLPGKCLYYGGSEYVTLPMTTTRHAQIDEQSGSRFLFERYHNGPLYLFAYLRHETFFDSITYFGIAEGTGHIELIDDDGGDNNAFANSSIDLFVECLLMMDDYIKLASELANDEALTRIQQVKQRIMDIDPAALDYGENMWAMIIQDCAFLTSWQRLEKLLQTLQAYIPNMSPVAKIEWIAPAC